MYHQIVKPCKADKTSHLYCVPTGVFARQMLFLSLSGYHPVTMSALTECLYGERSLPSKPVVITFDDGYLNMYTSAAPILRLFGFPATVYLVADCVGEYNQWDTALGMKRSPLMNLVQIKTLLSRGIEFGAHTCTHPHLRLIPIDQASDEISGAKRKLESATGFPINTFCYPYGQRTAFDPAIREIVVNSGYRAACGTVGGYVDQDADRFYLKRLWPKCDISMRQLMKAEPAVTDHG